MAHVAMRRGAAFVNQADGIGFEASKIDVGISKPSADS